MCYTTMNWACVLACVVASVTGSRLTWSSTYSYEAVLSVPGSGIQVPYKVWVDGGTGNTRVDFYNGLDKLYRLRMYGSEQFQYFKIVPETTDSESNIEVCRRVQQNDPLLGSYIENTYLPQRDFYYKGTEQLYGSECQIWKASLVDKIYGYNVTFSFTVWVAYKVVGNEAVTVPVRYEYSSYVEHRLIDHYFHVYTNFNTAEIDKVIFDLPDGVFCTDDQDLNINEPLDPLFGFLNPIEEHNRIGRHFEMFKYKHNKLYTSHDENFARLNTFRDNVRFLNSRNREYDSYSLAVNQFTDLKDEELPKYLDVSNDQDFDTVECADEEYKPNDDKSILFDWRDYGAVSRVKDQTNMCGSCYAFTAAAAVESALFINHSFKSMNEISEQAIIDCSWRFVGNSNIGCNGGNLVTTLAWIKSKGIPFKHQYGRYLAMEGLCHAYNLTKLAHIRDYCKVKNNTNAIKAILRQRGPLLVAVAASAKSFLFYSRGIYYDKDCGTAGGPNHAMLLVGYGQRKGRSFWILKNSYGKHWGEKGYIKMAMTSNICSAMNYVYSLSVV